MINGKKNSSKGKTKWRKEKKMKTNKAKGAQEGNSKAGRTIRRGKEIEKQK